MPDQHLPMIYIVSDATAETAQRTLRGALMQFRDVETTTRTFTMVRDREDMVDILTKAREREAFVISP